MANVNFKRGIYSKTVVEQLKDGELFFDTSAGTANNGIYMGYTDSTGVTSPIKVALGGKNYKTITDNAFMRGATLSNNLYMFTDPDKDTGVIYVPTFYNDRTGIGLRAGLKITNPDTGKPATRSYPLANMWAGESFGGKFTCSGWSNGIEDFKEFIKTGSNTKLPDLTSFVTPGYLSVSVYDSPNTTYEVTGIHHCKNNYYIEYLENGVAKSIKDFTGLFINSSGAVDGTGKQNRVGVIITGKTEKDILTAAGTTINVDTISPATLTAEEVEAIWDAA